MDKKLGLPSVISTGVGLIVATSCLMSLGQGAGALGTVFIVSMVLACAINICTALSMAELNALMAGMKWYGSNAANKEKGLPRSILMLTLNDKDTGAPLAFMSANILSAYRTGAVPGVGFKYFAKEDAETIGIVGPGVMSKTALAAAVAVRPSLKNVKVKGRGKASLQKFIDHAKSEYPELNIYAVDTIEEAVRDSDIVSVSTSCPTGDPSLYPYIAEEWIKPGAIIESTAALRFDDDFIINRARTVTDNIMLYEAWEEEMKPNAYNTIPITAVRVEDLIAEGKMKPEQIDDLGDVLLGNIPVHRKEGRNHHLFCRWYANRRCCMGQHGIS